ncbi:hypothetical protein GPAL_2645 [Glaciecola pallidula DSM 14239 = ACAM 615]|uniref:Uncharacterized protein n=1 Tax=Brumicola pallidula DSM 14239 = ACAM 615 TaxID=1121922 RepID=K6Y9S7_9ALTE|nr:hypothetical protein GPAL_2645 [Glaciecola pallidula DSM 14239 = ACAM 615]
MVVGHKHLQLMMASAKTINIQTNDAHFVIILVNHWETTR